MNNNQTVVVFVFEHCNISMQFVVNILLNIRNAIPMSNNQTVVVIVLVNSEKIIIYMEILLVVF